MIFLRMARFLAILFLYPPALPCFVCSRSALLCLLALRLALRARALPCFACLRSALLCLLALCLALSARALPCFACDPSVPRPPGSSLPLLRSGPRPFWPWVDKVFPGQQSKHLASLAGSAIFLSTISLGIFLPCNIPPCLLPLC